MLTNDYAVCIRATDYSETSQIVIFFTRQTGKVTVIARGSKRPRCPFGGPIEIFSCGKISFSDSSREKLAALIEFEPSAEIYDSAVLAGDLFVLNCCLFSVELVNLMTKDYDPHPGLFDALLEFLHNTGQKRTAETAKGGVLNQLVLFQLNLLRDIGLYPILEYCVNCKTPFSRQWREVYFSNSAKGLICKDCQGAFPDKIGLSQQAANFLADAKSLAVSKDQILRQVEDILIHYITDAIGRPPRMAKFILNK